MWGDRVALCEVNREREGEERGGGVHVVPHYTPH